MLCPYSKNVECPYIDTSGNNILRECDDCPSYKPQVSIPGRSHYVEGRQAVIYFIIGAIIITGILILAGIGINSLRP
jgi:hypothetical protein